MRKTLKRFERLENTTLSPDFLPDAELQTSKRFSKLEINDRNIKLTIEDKVAPQESVPQGKEYFFLCPYCGEQNPAELEVCDFCKHPLKKQYIADYVGKANLLKKCHCGAVNLKERKNCWVCGRDFSLWGDEEVKESPENIITLDIDGVTYKSTDHDLPEGIVGLMERIRREGYSKELVSQWIEERNNELDQKRDDLQTRISELRWDIIWRFIVLAIIAGFVFLRIFFIFHRY